MKFGRVGRDEPAAVDTDAAELRELRIAAARRNPKWTEIPEERLVRRGYRDGLFIDIDADTVFVKRRGATFCGPAIEFDADVPLAFFVGPAGPVLLEARGRWSTMFERQARSEARRTAATS